MATYKPGAYHIIGDGYLHDLPLTISFTADKIVGIEVKPGTKLHGLEKQAIPQVVDRILTEQTVDIDAITGATVSSDGLVDAVTDVIDAMPTTEPDGPAQYTPHHHQIESA
ncbi:FMN-binding protein [Lactiplantibacillus daowaiensis]|uniref:FMN-binding protein n=1 Tax=Lactiplantibacillus daowaiensis TaxID=2559918 RepID=A0ABW1RYT1_9LACO|nr:FMN-binding protein [Lactiplantibacillus daowaiensis]